MLLIEKTGRNTLDIEIVIMKFDMQEVCDVMNKKVLPFLKVKLFSNLLQLMIHKLQYTSKFCECIYILLL